MEEAKRKQIYIKLLSIATFIDENVFAEYAQKKDIFTVLAHPEQLGFTQHYDTRLKQLKRLSDTFKMQQTYDRLHVREVNVIARLMRDKMGNHEKPFVISFFDQEGLLCTRESFTPLEMTQPLSLEKNIVELASAYEAYYVVVGKPSERHNLREDEQIITNIAKIARMSGLVFSDYYEIDENHHPESVVDWLEHAKGDEFER